MKTRLITLLLFAVTNIMAQCPSGDYTFTTQQQINNFGTTYAACTNITLGKVTILAIGSDITDLTPLSGITSLTGNLYISSILATSLNGLNNIKSIDGDVTLYNNLKITNLNGLNGLISVGGKLQISTSTALTDISGLSNLTTVGKGLSFGANAALTNLTGLENITTLGGDLEIGSNTLLANINGLSNLTNIGGGLIFRTNPQLTSLAALSKVTTIGGSLIVQKTPITSLDGLSNVTTLGGDLTVENTNLANLNGLRNLTSIGGFLFINNNTLLTDISGLQHINPETISSPGLHITNNPALSVCNLLNLCKYLQGSGGRSISGNAGDCINEQAVTNACLLGNCSSYTAWNGTTWSNGLPDTTKRAVIQENLTLNTAMQACELGIYPNKSLTIPNGTSFTLAGNITNYGTLTINNGGVLLQTKTGLTNSGSITYNQTINDTNWHLTSSPIVDPSVDDFYTANQNELVDGTGGNKSLALYLESNNSWFYYNTNDAPYTGYIVETGQGVSIKLNAAGTVKSTAGAIPTSDVTTAITHNGDGFNLVGNPFPAYFNTASFLTSNSGKLASQTLWIWNGTSYDTYNLANTITVAPTQGFFIQANASGTVTFAMADQTNTGTTLQKSAATNKKITLTVTSNTNTETAKVYYIEGSTTGFDNGYDSAVFGGIVSNFSVYTHLVSDDDGKNLAIQSLPDSDYENMVIPIGITAKAGKTIVFRATEKNLPNNLRLYLEDKNNNSFTQLDKTDASYTTTVLQNSPTTGRFYLHTTAAKPLSVEDFATQKITVYVTKNRLLKITGTNNPVSIQLINVLGRTVFTTKKSNQVALPARIKTGAYIVKIQTPKAQLTKKVIVQ